jgi:hypothetical protein
VYSDVAKFTTSLGFGVECLLTSRNPPQRVPLAMAFSRGAVRGTQRPLAHANVDVHYLEGDRLEAVHSMEQVRAHRMNESAAATASRHGAEKMAPHSSQLRTGGVYPKPWTLNPPAPFWQFHLWVNLNHSR